MEPGHPLHSALTRPSSAKPQLESSICTRRTTSHQFIWQQHMRGAVGGLPMEWRVDGQTHKTPFSSPTPANPPEWPSPEEPGSGSTASAPVLDVSPPACTNGVWPPLRLVSVAQKNKPSTMLSSSVQSIDFPMDCMAWWCWTTRQLNGCSTPAPRSSAPKQWFQQLVQKKSFMKFYYSKLWQCMLQKLLFLQLASAGTVTRPDQGVEQASALDSASS